MRLIDADALMEQRVYTVKVGGKFPYEKAYKNMLHDIENAPTIEAAPIIHGHWIKNELGGYDCSICNATYYCKDNHCGSCGAKMDEEVKDKMSERKEAEDQFNVAVKEAKELLSSFYLIQYTDSSDVKEPKIFEPKIFTGWFSNAKSAVNEFARRKFYIDGEHFEEANMDHTLDQIINNYNLYHTKSQILTIWSDPNVVWCGE